jgi:hypothetical protein
METLKTVFHRNRDEFIKLFFILSLGLLVRIFIIPFSMTTEADAVSRVFIAWHWLSDPNFISWGVWPPLHTYLIALALWLVEDPVWAPLFLHIFFSVCTSIPLFYFTKNEFGKNGALFVTCTYQFYPVAVRNSLMALSEIPFVFFVVFALLFISLYRRNTRSWIYPLAAGISITLASMLRFEGWILTPLLSIFFYKQPKYLVAFLITASTFPALWMVGNQLHYGDFLHSITVANIDASSYWQTVFQQSNEKKLLWRIGYFPSAIFFGLTPLVASLSIIGAIISLNERKGTALWLIPFLGLFSIFLIKAANGSLLLRSRYTLILGILLLPFIKVVIDKIPNTRNSASTFFTLIIFTMIPFAYAGNFLPKSITKIIPTDIKAIPRVDNSYETVESISTFLQKQPAASKEALICDFWDWQGTYYVVLMSRIHPDNILVVGEAEDQSIDFEKLSHFLNLHPSGIIILKTKSAFAKKITLSQGNNLKIDSLNQVIKINSLKRIIDPRFIAIEIFHYQVVGSS